MGQNVHPQKPVEIKPSRYRLLGLVGQGQFGRVYCAVDRQTGALVALKDLDQRRFPTKQFLRELRFLLTLQHPNIVACQTLEHRQDSRYLVMDYCEAGTLRSLLELEEPLSLVQSLQIITDILLGLEYAHHQGIVHCDIKPENILLSLEPKGWRARISDFGVARLSQELAAGSSGYTGSPAYMAPERFYGQYSPASDLYSVGVLLFEMVAGYRPFSGVPAALMSAHLNQPVQIPEAIPFPLRSTVATALQKLPQRRFASSTEMLKSLALATQVAVSAQTEVGFWVKSPENAQTVDFNSQRQEPLESPIHQLAIQGDHLYWGMSDRLTCRIYGSDLFDGQVADQWQVSFPQPLRQLHLTAQACFVLTQSGLTAKGNFSYSFYGLPRNPMQVAGREKTLGADKFTLFSLVGQNLLAAIDPQGQWMAYAVSSGQGDNDLIPLQLLSLRHLKVIPSQVSALPLIVVQVLNHRYGVAIASGAGGSAPRGSATKGCLLQVFNRRGQSLIRYRLPLGIKQLTPGSGATCLAVESAAQPQGLLIDFKPWRVQRIPLAIAPDFIRPTPWGYVLANQAGQVLLLNDLGAEIASFQVPGQLTAIATFNTYGLLIATWKENQGVLYTVDLRDFNLELIF